MTENTEKFQMSKGALFPLLVGITGHRDLRNRDIPTLKEKIQEIFEHYRSDYPDTPLTLMTALAEGADRITAEVALSMGASLVAVLPLPQEEYERDFSTAGSLAEFRTLLSKSDQVITVEQLSEDVSEYNENRNTQYEMAGAYIVQHSAFLLALWDGKFIGKQGGTGEVVRFAIEGLPKKYRPRKSPLAPRECSLVYHIVTPREKDEDVPENALSAGVVYPPSWGDVNTAKKNYRRRLKRIASYNSDVKRFVDRKSEEVYKNIDYVYPEAKQKNLAPALKKLLAFYGLSDTLAIHFQKRQKLFQFISVFSVALTYVLFDLYDNHGAEYPGFLFAFAGLLIFSYLGFFYVKQKDFERKFMDYRALAEGLRVQFFWKLGGVEESVLAYYLHKHQGDMGWIRSVLFYINMNFLDNIPPLSEEEKKVQQKEVYTHWVDDQACYFSKAFTRMNSRFESLEKLTSRFYFAAMSIIIVFFLYELIPSLKNSSGFESVVGVFMMVFGGLLAFGAAIASFVQSMAYGEKATQFSRMGIFYARAKEEMNKDFSCDDCEDVETILFELGKAALSENGDWYEIHVRNLIEPPSTG